MSYDYEVKFIIPRRNPYQESVHRLKMRGFKYFDIDSADLEGKAEEFGHDPPGRENTIRAMGSTYFDELHGSQEGILIFLQTFSQGKNTPDLVVTDNAGKEVIFQRPNILSVGLEVINLGPNADGHLKSCSILKVGLLFPAEVITRTPSISRN